MLLVAFTWLSGVSWSYPPACADKLMFPDGNLKLLDFIHIILAHYTWTAQRLRNVHQTFGPEKIKLTKWLFIGFSEIRGYLTARFEIFDQPDTIPSKLICTDTYQNVNDSMIHLYRYLTRYAKLRIVFFFSFLPLNEQHRNEDLKSRTGELQNDFPKTMFRISQNIQCGTMH